MELLIAAVIAAQLQKPVGPNGTPPQGQRIEAKDGDIIFVRGDARVRVVHRSEAMVRAIYNAEQRWLILLADVADPQKGGPDGLVDVSYRFDQLDGVWGERWEGSAALDDYGGLLGPTAGLGFSAGGAFVQLLQGAPMPSNAPWYADSRATQLSYRGSGRTGSPGLPGRATFAQAEERALADTARSAEARARGGGSLTTFPLPGGRTATSAVSMSAGAVMSPDARASASGEFPSPQAPVRVGGNIATPRKIADARPVMPAAAEQANVRGVVILEIVIGADGAVGDAKVLRSIPLLDQAALDAVKQWRYEPTSLNGLPVPVIMTVTVAFP